MLFSIMYGKKIIAEIAKLAKISKIAKIAKFLSQLGKEKT